jgi:hypothetical protein
MVLIALIAAAEAMLYSASRSKRGQTRRQQLLMGNSLDSVRALPLVDEYLKRKTAGASSIERRLTIHGRTDISMPHCAFSAEPTRRMVLPKRLADWTSIARTCRMP